MNLDAIRTAACLVITLQTFLTQCKSMTYRFGCVWRSSISSTLPDAQEFVPLSTCDSGELQWYYPKGSLRTTFTHHSSNTDFSLCLVDNEKNHLMKIYNETAGGNYVLPSPSPGQDTCVSSLDGRVVLNFEAPSQRHRLAVIEYRRQIQQPP